LSLKERALENLKKEKERQDVENLKNKELDDVDI